MVDHDDGVLDALRQARPDDLPDELVSPRAPAAQALLKEILSMQNTNTSPRVVGAAATELPPATVPRARGRRTRVALIGVAAAVVAAAMASAALQSNRTSTRTEGNEAGALLDPAVALPETLVSATSEANGLEHCQSGHADLIGADEIDDGLRLMPTWLPEGFDVDQTWARHETLDCPTADPLLFLRSVGEGDTIAGTIKLQGPYANPLPRGNGPIWTETTVRGGPALRLTLPDQPVATLVAFTWTEGGASWWIEGSNVTPETLLQVAESLDLDAAAGPGEAAATLPDDAIPAGFERTWHAIGTPAVADDTRWWHVALADATQPHAEGCTVSLHSTTLEQPVATGGTADSTLHVVRGHQAVAIPQGGTMLFWDERPGIIGEVACPTDVATATRIAESLVPVEPTDPRLRPLED